MVPHCTVVPGPNQTIPVSHFGDVAMPRIWLIATNPKGIPVDLRPCLETFSAVSTFDVPSQFQADGRATASCDRMRVGVRTSRQPLPMQLASVHEMLEGRSPFGLSPDHASCPLQAKPPTFFAVFGYKVCFITHCCTASLEWHSAAEPDYPR